jgi:hypothetical protein
MRLGAALVALCACSAYASPRAPAYEDDVATDAEVAAWARFEDAVCHEAGTAELDDGRVRVSLPRAAFFPTNGVTLTPGGASIAREVGALAKTVRRAVKLEIHLEDDAARLPGARRLAAERAQSLRTLFEVPAHVAVDAETWAGSYDGPALLDPSDGRVELALATADGRTLQKPGH